MRSASTISGTVRDHESPLWAPLEAAVGRHRANWFMWMFEVELDDGTSLHVYKHIETRRSMHLAEDGRAFAYIGDQAYMEYDRDELVELVHADWEPGDIPERRRAGYPRGMLCILDGAVMDSADATVSILDEGLLRGDGVFEVARVYAGRPFALDEHLERMVRSASAIRLPFDPDAVRADALALLEATGSADGALRLVVTRGGRRIGILHPLPAFPETISLATITYTPTRVLDGVKSLSYGANMLATRLAKEAGADEALLVTPHERVLEGPTTSFFYVLGGELFTPPLSDRILDSISRRVLLEVTDASERVTVLDDLPEISEAFLASSLREVQPVSSIDDRAIPEAPGPVSVDAATRVREHIEAALNSAA